MSFSGIHSPQFLQQACRELSSIPAQGYMLSGLGIGETRSQCLTAIQTVKESIPSSAMVYFPCATTPDMMLDLVAAGCDLIETYQPFRLSTEGLLCTFPTDFSSEELEILCQGGTSSEVNELLNEQLPPPKLNLRDCAFARDKSSVCSGAPVAGKHSKAYLHHLFNTTEMLGNTLLAIANLHVYLSFMDSVRRHLAEGTFDAFHDAFRRYWRHWSSSRHWEPQVTVSYTKPTNAGEDGPQEASSSTATPTT